MVRTTAIGFPFEYAQEFFGPWLLVTLVFFLFTKEFNF